MCPTFFQTSEYTLKLILNTEVWNLSYLFTLLPPSSLLVPPLNQTKQKYVRDFTFSHEVNTYWGDHVP